MGKRRKRDFDSEKLSLPEDFHLKDFQLDDQRRQEFQLNFKPGDFKLDPTQLRPYEDEPA